MKEAFSPSGLSKLLTLLLFFTFSACQKSQGPEIESAMALKKYLEFRLSGVRHTRADILPYTTATYKLAIESLTDEEFSQFENLVKIQKDSFQVTKTECKGRICLLSYSLKYTTMEGSEKAFSSEVEKMAILHLVDSVWKIADISPLSTKHDSLIPLNVPKNK